MVRFGVIGTNWITERLLKAAEAAEDFKLTAVYSRTKKRAEEFAGKYGVTTVFTSLEEMAESQDIDAVYIASPNAFHAEQTELFLKNGKHVLCEKPAASNAAEFRRMMETARTHGTVLMEAMKSTLMPNFKSVEDHLPEIGRVRTYYASYCQYSSRYDAYREGTVLNAFKPELSNGALMDLGVYTIYPLVALFGRPNKIQASGQLLETGADALGSIILSYDTMDAVVMYSKTTDSSLPSEIHGEDGTIIIHHVSSPEKIELHKRGSGSADISREQAHDPMYYEIEEFISLILNRKLESDRNTWDTSLAVLEIMDEARRQIGIVYPSDTK